MPATGGQTSALTTLAPRQSSHRWPHFLPDGKRFLYYVRGALDVAGIYLGALDGKPPIHLTAADSQGEYLPFSGWLAWVRAGALVAQRLNEGRTALTGEPVTLANGVFVDQTNQMSAISVSASELIAYRTGGGAQRQLTWLDRSGTPRGVVGDPDDTIIDPRISPDGRLPSRCTGLPWNRARRSDCSRPGSSPAARTRTQARGHSSTWDAMAVF